LVLGVLDAIWITRGFLVLVVLEEEVLDLDVHLPLNDDFVLIDVELVQLARPKRLEWMIRTTFPGHQAGLI
jgi:hypothetical protein